MKNAVNWVADMTVFPDIQQISEDLFVVSKKQLSSLLYQDRYIDILYEAGFDNWHGMEYVGELLEQRYPQGMRNYYQSGEWVKEVALKE